MPLHLPFIHNGKIYIVVNGILLHYLQVLPASPNGKCFKSSIFSSVVSSYDMRQRDLLSIWSSHLKSQERQESF